MPWFILSISCGCWITDRDFTVSVSYMRVYESNTCDSEWDDGWAGMEFQLGRLDGLVTVKSDGRRWLSVVLDTGRDVETVRDEIVPEALGNHDAALLAEQFVQEALANELAEEGWEVVGEGDTAHESHRLLDVVARSRTWVVRRRYTRPYQKSSPTSRS